jgi:enoyl-CoA hydratase
MSEYVKSERAGNVMVWTVDRPSARNAIDNEVVAELELALAEAERDVTLRAIILTGGGESAFLSGADLKLLSGGPPELRASVDVRIRKLLARIETLPIPVIAAINGVVMGGGCEVALACDLRIAEAHATLTFKHAAMSVTPGWGGLTRLCRAVRPGIASKLLFTALPLNAQEAREVGLVDEVVAKGTAKTRALELVHAVEQTSPGAIADLKHLLRMGYAGTLTAEEEERVFLARTESPDHREALAAFREKRKPAFLPRDN